MILLIWVIISSIFSLIYIMALGVTLRVMIIIIPIFLSISTAISITVCYKFIIFIKCLRIFVLFSINGWTINSIEPSQLFIYLTHFNDFLWLISHSVVSIMDNTNMWAIFKSELIQTLLSLCSICLCCINQIEITSTNIALTIIMCKLLYLLTGVFFIFINHYYCRICSWWCFWNEFHTVENNVLFELPKHYAGRNQ